MNDFWAQLAQVLRDGGVLMIVLFILALAIYWLAFDTLSLIPKSSTASESLIAELHTADEVTLFEKQHLDFYKSRKVLLQILVTTAPLLGLLGTVTGMLATFQGLNEGSGNTLDLVAAGISEAMITTETGLVIAIPASLLVMRIRSRIQSVEMTLARIVNRYQRNLLTN